MNRQNQSTNTDDDEIEFRFHSHTSPSVQITVDTPGTTLRFKEFFASKFNGTRVSSPYAHIFCFTDYCGMHGAELTSDELKIERFKFTLEGKARLWVEGKQFTSFDELAEAFTGRFSGISSRNGAIESFNRTRLEPGEKVEEYLQRLVS